MSIYRKERNDTIFTVTEGQNSEMTPVVPKMYGILLAGILLLMATILCWSIFGTIDESVSIMGLYDPQASDDGEIVAFVPIQKGKILLPGMDATVSLVGYETQEMGQMSGKITFVEGEITDIQKMKSILKDDTLVNVFTQQGPVVQVDIKLKEDPDSANGYAWTHKKGESIVIQDFTYANITVIKDSLHPITLGISGVSDFFGK